MGPNPSLQQLAAAAAVAMTASEPPPQPRARVVRILVHDADATDSSSSEDEAPPPPPRRARGGSSSVKEEGGSYDGQVEGGSSELKAFAPKPMWEMIPGKCKKRPGCGNGSCLRIAIHAASVCVEEVGGA
ncbi:ethylene-responsive transcription factor CRF1-like [Panicum miliaceum]|uniref:Ethylene-responsive transcription factor CRF1-like n=1 Tax=Panicum miliaceum TaxID=4540 RepID=A0A3L6TPF0_PANMI|nr:ethylene-responsive transcription factor CRF1-like [Panicum miliaceum]